MYSRMVNLLLKQIRLNNGLEEGNFLFRLIQLNNGLEEGNIIIQTDSIKQWTRGW